MAMPYHHRQWGTPILSVCGAAAIFAAVVVWRTGQTSMLFMLAIFIAAGTFYSSLTVDVDGNEVRWYFGPGFSSYRLALDDIETVAVVRNHWWNGLGYRIWPGFRLYNVSGLDAVELRLKSGGIRRIGTDDPQGLAAALKTAAST
jgi:hypothetical protein